MLPSWLRRVLVPLSALACLYPGVDSGVALVFGIALALTVGNPDLERTRKLTHRLLTFSVMGLGAGMNLGVIGRVGAQGVGYTVLGIATALALGLTLGRLLKTSRDTSLLITAGTAICGGSAIAALAPTIRAKHHEVSVALGTVFLLNAVALILFPWVGHGLGLSEEQFGLWSALAIHDTSSVVGATLRYGAHALEVGTTIKLARALWIVPLTLAIGYFVNRNSEASSGQKAKRPWFIVGFIAAAALVTWFPALHAAGHAVESVAKRLLVVTLFLIGSSLTRSAVQSVGIRPFVQGLFLWIGMASLSLGAIVLGWIRV